ncbi:hypothetical protein GCM10010439_41000 [Actinocorallia aurantiaca]|uniref:DUF4115 domain-containing protein n=2 Tax=Actinocorallia aurantiaca TaxID=46204 RepID=A0ABP6GR52_9ACTN
MALVSSFNTEAAAPGTSSSTTADPDKVLTSAKDDTAYARLEVVGKKVEVFAAAPGNTKVVLDGELVQGDVRKIIWKDLSLTISDSSAVRVFVGGERFPLPAKQRVTIEFVEGKPSIVG